MRRALATAICAPIRLRSPHSGQPTLRACFAGRRRHGSDGARQGKIARSWAVSWCASKAAHRLATVKPFQAAGRRPLEIGRVERATNRAGKSIEDLEFVQRAPIAVAWKQVVRAHFLRSGSGMYLSAVRLVASDWPVDRGSRGRLPSAERRSFGDPLASHLFTRVLSPRLVHFFGCERRTLCVKMVGNDGL